MKSINCIKIIMSGGLGNQLFQVCGGIYLGNRNKNIIYEVSNLTGIEKNEINNYTRELQVIELIKNKVTVDRKFHWVLRLLMASLKKKYFPEFYVFEKNPRDFVLARVTDKTREVHGFFQFSKLVEEVWPDFRDLLLSSSQFSPCITNQKINRIAVHMRFGDYFSDPKSKNYYGLTQPGYYIEGIKNFVQEYPELTEIFVVTDNEIHARDFLGAEKFKQNLVFKSSPNPIEDLIELARSSHLVISNSTFSWWGAWIADKVHHAKVIYPFPWLSEDFDPKFPIYVDNWKKLNRTYLT